MQRSYVGGVVFEEMSYLCLVSGVKEQSKGAVLG